MKQFLLIPTSALVAAIVMTSCQKEELSCTQLVNELTEVLQKVTDYDSAVAAAPRVEALMLRWQKAATRPIDFDGTSLHASSLDEGKAYLEALEKLVEQVARVKASYPSTSYDGDIDTERLTRAVGSGGVMKRPEAAAELKKGEAYIAKYQTNNTSFSGDANNSVNVFMECYGCAELKAALEIKAEPNPAVSGVFAMDGEADKVATPEYVEPAGGEAAEGAEEPAEGEEPAATDEETTDEEPSVDEPADEEPADSEETTDEEPSVDLDLDVSVDEEEPADEEPAEEEPADEEPAEESSEEEVTEDEPADEEPAEEETVEEEPAEEETEEEDTGDVDLDIGDLDL